MDSEVFSKKRKLLMKTMKNSNPFFAEFGLLDDKAFSEGAIPQKYKELAMVAMSIQARCSECIAFHIPEAVKAGAVKEELIDAIKMGQMAGGSLAYPFARFAFEVLVEMGLVQMTADKI